MTQQPRLFDLTEGRARRDRGLRLVEMADPINPWHTAALRAITILAAQPGTFTSDTLRDAVGDPPKPNQIGKVFKEAADADIIVWRGDLEQSGRPEAHGRWVKVWAGTRNGMTA